MSLAKWLFSLSWACLEKVYNEVSIDLIQHVHAVTWGRSPVNRSGVHFGGSGVACEDSKRYVAVTSGVVFDAQEAPF